jgi:hypothetical protein
MNIQNQFDLPKSKIRNGTFSTPKNYGKFKTDIFA